jgi:branched-chain amino acid transport system permease protein
MAREVAEASDSTLRSLMRAVIDALSTALVALGLAVPILALRTEQNIYNELILQPRWRYVGIAVLGAFLARLAYLLLGAARPWPKRLRPALPGRLRQLLGRSFAFLGLGVLVLYPLLALALTGKAGAISASRS